MTLISSDFVDGGPLDARFSADAFNGQCTGDNLSPHLSWSGAPEGTVTFAITMRDLSAGNLVHWLHINIPPTTTEVGTGASETLPGTAGRNAVGADGYFGPCAPGTANQYEFTVHALDFEYVPATDTPNINSFVLDTRGHVLATASIVGIYIADA
jgi:hypothetical protein